MMIWDNQRSDPGAPNEVVVTACNIILSRLDQYRKAMIKAWDDQGLEGEKPYTNIHTGITDIRNRARAPSTRITESDYRIIGMSLYTLYLDKHAGLSAADISLHARLGLETGQHTTAQGWSEIMDSSVLAGLGRNQIAQVFWYVKTGPPATDGSVPLGLHAFLVGRLASGEWFLSDQGPSPPTEIRASSLFELRLEIEKASREGRSWIYTGRPNMVVVGAWTGVRLLAGPHGVQTASEKLVIPGTFLAEVDAGWDVTGERIVSEVFASRHYSLADARKVKTLDGGGLIVEMPQGVFNYYRTNPVSDENLKVSDIDREDSADGLLMKRTFFHAWLQLCSENACKAELIKVY